MVDEFIYEKANAIGISPNVRTGEEQLEILKEVIKRAENGEEQILSNEEVNDYINKKYGF